ncbi:LapA family protein [Streptomyces sp. NPDC098789]|uniref:LapA family protein n=1 Tax=unclassified Streptomyces TaxID=2593676 RepID=UPI003795A756
MAGLVLAGLAVWFVLINTRTARIHFWIPWVDAPMWFVLAVTFLAGAATAWLLGRRGK